MEVLQWAHEHGCPWNDYTCGSAARGGHLKVLQWARKNECEWNWMTCMEAAERGHVKILRWALENGCEWKHIPWNLCNKIEILQLAYEHRTLYNPEVVIIDAECVAFMQGDYGEAWKKRSFELPHYWNIHIKGANEQ